MNRTILALVVTLLVACASQPETSTNNAIEDFVVVSELEELDIVKMREQFHYRYLSERYVILTTRKANYLVEFRRRCRELNQNEITPDIRFERNTLHSGFDTIRGCRIEHMFAIDKGQAQELESLGKAPGEED